MHLYVVRLDGGQNDRNWNLFHRNVINQNGKSPDFAGISNVVLIKHHGNKDHVRDICSEGFRGRNNLSVEEITRETLSDNQHYHYNYTDIVNNYFLSHDTFPEIE